NVNINGNGVNAEGLRAGILSPGSRVQLGGLTQTGTVNFNENFYSTFPQGVTRGNVSLSNGAEINVRAAGGGSITINSRNLNVNENSRVRGGIQKNLGSVNAQAGNIEINNIEQVTLDNAVIANIVDEFSKGNAGDINIHSSSLTLKNGSTINTSVFAGTSNSISGNNNNTIGKSQLGSITINASNDVTVKNGGRISSETYSFYDEENVADAGNITITTPTLNLEGGYISANTEYKGNAGNIRIEAIGGEGVNISNRGAISSSVLYGGTGTAGKITITTPTLNLEGGYISANTEDKGNAGNIRIEADNINIAGYNRDYNNYSRITSNTSGSGKGGNIDITTYNNPNLNINVGDKTIISASTAAQGSGGNVKITAPQKINIQGKGTIEASTLNTGSAGTIEIRSNNLNLSNGLQIVTSTSNKGNAGDITFKITDNLKLTNSTISSGATSDSTGKAGNINIDPTLIELDGSQITVNSQGSGDGGNITLTGDNLNLNNSTISASTKSGQGGNITLNIPDTIRQNNSKIEASAGENGNGGNVTINTKFIIGNSGENRISTNAKQGAGGNIKITTQGIFGYKDNQISASSETGVNGVVDTKTPEVDPSQGLIDLPENLLTAAIVTNSCRQGQNSLIVKGRGGLA
ncbi:beta strand repeat-containing protein, partial [Dolichospermum planctonicum]|uniref:beta strand repeat-containing protein n=1 Tax=Dolichospermum planctonicum TaxID=136072 RepID=UPI001396A139